MSTATPQRAWAAVGKKSGMVLRNLAGHYAIYVHRDIAHLDCPDYGEVLRVRITIEKVQP